MADQQITNTQLDNGLTVLIEHMPAVQSAAFTMLVPAGSTNDPAGQNGTASILSEMISRGAGDRDTRELSSTLDNLGVQRSEAAGMVHMSFSGATIADKLSEVLQIYGDIILRPQLPEHEFEASRASVAQTLTAMQDEPRQKMLLELRKRCYDAPFGLPTDGTLEDLPNISHASVCGHYERCFRPNDAILSIAGNVDANEICDTIAEHFGGWSSKDVAPPERTPCSGESEHVIHDSAQTHIGIAYKSVPYRDKDYYNAWAAVSLLSGGMSSRLFTEVREKRGLCYAISASLNTLREDARVMCYAGTTNERAQETLDVTIQELRRLQEGITQNELDRCRVRAKSSLIMQQESTIARAGSIARDWFHLGRVQTLQEVSDRVDGLTVDSILSHVRNYPPQDFTIVTLGPEQLDVSAATETT